MKPTIVQHIPAIMHANQMIVGAQLMTEVLKRKEAGLPMDAPPGKNVIKMSWVLKYGRAPAVFTALTKDRVWMNSAACAEIYKYLNRDGLLADMPRRFD